MEAPLITRELDNEDKALKSLLVTFGSAFSLEEIASTFCKAGRDANLVGDILRGMQTGSSADAVHASEGLINCEISSESLNDNYYINSCSANSKNLKTSKLKRDHSMMGINSHANGKNYVCRIAGATKPVKVEANGFSVPANTSHEPFLSRDADLGSSGRSSSARNVSSNDDIENFLFKMLGRGCQLGRSTIQEVLGNCGYDLKKSLAILLDLTAATLDRRNNICEGSRPYSNSKSHVQKQNSAESKGSRTSRTNLIPLRKPNERYEQADFTVGAHVLESVTRSRKTMAVMTELLKDFVEDTTIEVSNPHLNNMKDDAEEGSYYNLRKAVKEHRDTMKGYYKAAAEALAKGDSYRATILLEKGQFYNKKAREADEESAKKIFDTSSGDDEVKNEMFIDLQDHDAKEAIRLVKLHLRTLSGIPLVNDLKIMIGNGDQDAEKRKRLILKLLEKEAIKWVDDDNNLGILLIRLEEIDPFKLSFGTR